MSTKLLTEQCLEILSLKGSCTGSSEATLAKMPHCWKSHVTAHTPFAEVIFFAKCNLGLLVFFRQQQGVCPEFTFPVSNAHLCTKCTLMLRKVTLLTHSQLDLLIALQTVWAQLSGSTKGTNNFPPSVTTFVICSLVCLCSGFIVSASMIKSSLKCTLIYEADIKSRP